MRLNKWLLLWLLLSGMVLSGCNMKGNFSTNSDSIQAPKEVEMTEQLEIEDLVVGTGVEAIAGKKIKVHYSGKLMDGSQFDSSRDRKEPFEFVLGAGQVIRGWDEGVVGMKTGGRRQLTIPSDKAYGERGVPGVIPANSILIFDIELLEVH